MKLPEPPVGPKVDSVQGTVYCVLFSETGRTSCWTQGPETLVTHGHWTLCSGQCTEYTVYSVQCTVNTEQFIQCTVFVYCV